MFPIQLNSFHIHAVYPYTDRLTRDLNIYRTENLYYFSNFLLLNLYSKRIDEVSEELTKS